ncbi:choice-of-anchor M domain-containing protein [Conexibacter stalactiti]|uniref:Choice-of-anchor M domain-containing protein n=1 Tax=Conexibacter stalactiti TaxID=1940611 RepID=A0ABU4HZM3_9ACTN|nr:choice-of-anchor M domain-containing protein [Conexibacter stalactiti]MDW5598786.1 choice-of-anchor M domain-containing protein [Conexibacter stalactiti]MEC5039428.1 choice-of-anchor M domain-containing protein [Conexibacter stalactiti]
MKLRALLIGLVAVLAAALAPALAGAALPTQERHVLSVGHVDAIAPEWAGGRLSVRLHDDSGEAGEVERDPGDVLLHAKPESEVQIPDGLDPAFYAVWGEPGATRWLLPQTQNPDLVWAGWSSESIPAGVFEGDTLTWRLISVSGPGWLKIFNDSPFGLPQMKLDGSQALPVSTQMGVATHAHFNWLFSAKGLYRIRFEVSGTPLGGSAVSSGSVEYRVFVGDLADLPDDPAAPELAIAGLRDPYAPGERVELTAVQTPQTDLDHYHWFSRCGSATEFTEVGGGGAHAFDATLEHDGCDYRVTLYGDSHAALATSPAVTLHVAAPPVVTPPVVEPPVVVPPVLVPPVTVPPAVPPGTDAPQAASPGRRAAATALALRTVSAKGRQLSVAVRLGSRARVTVRVLRGTRVVSRGSAGVVKAGSRTLRVRLGKRLGAGRYRVVVTARTGGRTVTRTVSLRIG